MRQSTTRERSQDTRGTIPETTNGGLAWLRGELVKVWDLHIEFTGDDEVWRMHVTTGKLDGVNRNSETIQGTEVCVCVF